MSRIKDYKVTLQYLHEEVSKAVEESKGTDTPLLTPKSQAVWDKLVTRLSEMQEKDNLPPVASDVFQVHLFACVFCLRLIDLWRCAILKGDMYMGWLNCPSPVSHYAFYLVQFEKNFYLR